MRSGVASHKTPGGRKKSPLPGMLRRISIITIVLAALVLVIYFVARGWTPGSKAVYLNALPTYDIQAMGENAVYYDGITLTCVNPRGGTNWTFSLGAGGGFRCTDTTVTAWRDTQVHVLDKNGKSLLTDQLDATVRFARTGESYVAICMGDELSSSVRVLDRSGTVLEVRQYPDLYLLDMGYLYTKGQYMWVLALDPGGNAPVTNLSTLEPGKMSTGVVELQDELVYSIYPQGNNLMVVDTSKIRTFNYRCVEQADLGSILVYGWQLKQVREVGRNTHVLMEPVPSSGTASTFSELRVLTNNSLQSLRLLSPCFAGGLGEKGIYAFGDNVVYYAPYGAKIFTAHYVNYPQTALMCMLSGNRAVVASGDAVIIVELPT